MVVFVAGVHGVGKTHLCQALARKTGLRHASASQLIREVTQSVSWKNDKVVTDIEGNQDALIIAVDEIMQHEDVLILDGHFVLKKALGVFETLPLATFERLGLSAIILIENDVEVIAGRLLQRDSNNATGDLKDFIDLEKRTAVDLSFRLGIPFYLMHGPSCGSFSNCVESIIELSSGKQ